MEVEDFINLNQGNMSVEEYSLKFTMLFRYAPSLVSNHKNEMSSFMITVADLVKEECRMAMRYYDIGFSRIMIYTQSINESKLRRISRNFMRSESNEKNQHRFKKRVLIQDGPNSPKVKLEKGSGSQNGKPTCVTCGKKHYGNV